MFLFFIYINIYICTYRAYKYVYATFYLVVFSVKRDCGHFFRAVEIFRILIFLKTVFISGCAGPLLLFSSCGKQRGPSLVVVL